MLAASARVIAKLKQEVESLQAKAQSKQAAADGGDDTKAELQRYIELLRTKLQELQDVQKVLGEESWKVEFELVRKEQEQLMGLMTGSARVVSRLKADVDELQASSRAETDLSELKLKLQGMAERIGLAGAVDCATYRVSIRSVPCSGGSAPRRSGR